MKEKRTKQSFCLPVTAARPVDPRFIDFDGLAAHVGGIVLEKELPFLQGSFGVVLIIGARFFTWPILKKYGWPLMRKWFCNAPPKPSPQKLLLEQVTEIKDSMKVVVERGAPVPSPASAPSSEPKHTIM